VKILQITDIKEFISFPFLFWYSFDFFSGL